MDDKKINTARDLYESCTKGSAPRFSEMSRVAPSHAQSVLLRQARQYF